MSSRQCPFLEWKNSGIFSASYRCRKTDQDIATGSSLYSSYCNNYESSYSQCPNFKPVEPAGGCYLTSACVEAMGLPDDCSELTLLRNFRDNWLRKQPDGERDILHYYRCAPQIVSAIHACGDAHSILQQLYYDLVLPCCKAICEYNYQTAYQLYRDKAMQLEKRFL